MGQTIMTRAQVRLSLARTLILASLLLWASPAWAAFGSVDSFCNTQQKTSAPDRQLDLLIDSPWKSALV
jgi:hypothetical protein